MAFIAWFASAGLFLVLAWVRAGWHGETILKVIAGSLLVLPGVMVFSAPAILVACVTAWIGRALAKRIQR